MNRIDETQTEADFIEFKFASVEFADRAEKMFPTDFVRSTGTTVEYRANARIPEVRRRLEADGLSWSENESSITEADMWPDWPDDEDEDDSLTP